MTTVANDNLLREVQKQIRESMNSYSDHVSGGACEDYQQYAKCVGIIQGLAYAERIILDLDDRMTRQ